jgi:hypothetical protein
MAALLEICSRDEHRSVIHFLSSEVAKPIQIHRRMKTQYGDARLLLQQVYEWNREFKYRVSREDDADRPGRSHTAYTPETVEDLERVIEKTVMLQLMRLPSNFVLAMALLTTLCTMYSSTKKGVQDGCQDDSH